MSQRSEKYVTEVLFQENLKINHRISKLSNIINIMNYLKLKKFVHEKIDEVDIIISKSRFSILRKKELYVY